jgi:hypothetical protein
MAVGPFDFQTRNCMAKDRMYEVTIENCPTIQWLQPFENRTQFLAIGLALFLLL